PVGAGCRTSRRARSSPRPSAPTCDDVASVSSGRRSSTRTCRRSGWSTTTWSAAFATPRSPGSGSVVVGRETLEPQELAETVEAGRSAISTRVAVTAAILAVLASLSALQAERTAAESILRKNEAVLAQSRASDEWAYRQAKSIKLHLQDLAPGHEAADADRPRADIAARAERARQAGRLRDA